MKIVEAVGSVWKKLGFKHILYLEPCLASTPEPISIFFISELFIIMLEFAGCVSIFYKYTQQLLEE